RVGPRPCSEAKRLIGRPQEALLCAKAKRQRQSAQSERKSTPYFVDETHKNLKNFFIFIITGF
ncbi:hypothetical protein, partial [Lysinibacillus sp. NPDC093688]|uniref:hypothetical protein n=1 Tax=Lysinibacillus sp. NPDC093688 TaxID=3390577 RepID=UPI003D09352E